MKKSAAPEKATQKGKKKKGSKWSTILLIVLLLIGAGIIAYPTVADWWNSYHQSRAVAAYASAVDEASEEEIAQILAAAHAYNEALPQKSNPYLVTDDDLRDYMSQLDLTGNGIMGYVQIESIGVNLPIYHTTEESVLQIAIGHLEWSSLPVGGVNTHCLLSGHRGLPSARLFTDLDKLKEGDVFTLTVLRQTAYYRVDQIRIVEPHEVSTLGVVEGQDLCTLITCTPYGINTHRLLVRGHRFEPDQEEPAIIVSPEAVRIPNYITIPAVAIPLLFLSLVFALVFSSKRKRHLTVEELRKKL